MSFEGDALQDHMSQFSNLASHIISMLMLINDTGPHQLKYSILFILAFASLKKIAFACSCGVLFDYFISLGHIKWLGLGVELKRQH